MNGAGTVLVVCTGNVCRSPYMERRLRQELTGTGIDVVSAGTGALVGRDMDPGTRDRLVAAGADPDGFRAQQLTPELLDRADLVVTAAREHRGSAARLHPAVLRRAFTLRDLADLLEGVSRDELVGPDEVGNRVRRVADAALARRAVVTARQEGVDIHDPIGRGPDSFARMARQVDDALPWVVAALRGDV